MAAVTILNAFQATGPRTDKILFGKQINHIVLYELKLSKLLNSFLRLFNYWTLMQFAIQTIIIHLFYRM
jgi:hypothetical protein